MCSYFNSNAKRNLLHYLKMKNTKHTNKNKNKLLMYKCDFTTAK